MFQKNLLIIVIIIIIIIIKNEDAEITTHKKRYISPEERQKIINELRLVPKKDEYF